MTLYEMLTPFIEWLCDIFNSLLNFCSSLNWYSMLDIVCSNTQLDVTVSGHDISPVRTKVVKIKKKHPSLIWSHHPE